MRWRWPPENSCGYLRAVGRRQAAPGAGSSPTWLSQIGLVLGETEGADRLGDDVEHAPARIEAGIRVLEDHLHAPAECGHVGAAARAGHVVAVELDRARGRRIEADHQARHRRLAAARFAHQREGLALGDLEVDAVDRLHDLARPALERAHQPGRRDVEVALQALDLDELVHGAVRHRPAPSPTGAPTPPRSCSQQAARLAPAAIRLGPLDQAALAAEGAARVEGAARRDLGQPRHGAVDLGQLVVAHAETRDRAHQAHGVGVLGVLDHVAHRADLGDAAGIHHRHAIGGLGDHAHVVGDQHHRGAVLAAELLQQRDDLRLDRDVERGRRLVGHDQARLGAERQRDHHALAHAAGELVRIVVDALLRGRDADLLQQVDGALARLAALTAADGSGSSR